MVERSLRRPWSALVQIRDAVKALTLCVCLASVPNTARAWPLFAAPNADRSCSTVPGASCRPNEPCAGGGESRVHTGIDLVGHAGDRIVSPIAGRIVYVGWRRGYGGTVVVEAADHSASLYGRRSFKIGNRVSSASTSPMCIASL